MSHESDFNKRTITYEKGQIFPRTKEEKLSSAAKDGYLIIAERLAWLLVVRFSLHVPPRVAGWSVTVENEKEILFVFLCNWISITTIFQ